MQLDPLLEVQQYCFYTVSILIFSGLSIVKVASSVCTDLSTSVEYVQLPVVVAEWLSMFHVFYFPLSIRVLQ